MDEEPSVSQIFDLLTNEDMEVIAVQVVALAETIRNTVAKNVSEQRAAKMDYTSDAVHIYINLFREAMRAEQGQE